MLEEILYENKITISSNLSIKKDNNDVIFTTVFLDKLEYLGESYNERYNFEIGFDFQYIKFDINDISKSTYLYSKTGIQLIEQIDDNHFKFYERAGGKAYIDLTYNTLKMYTLIDRRYFNDNFNIDYVLLARMDILEKNTKIINNEIRTKNLFKNINFIINVNWFLYLDEFLYVYEDYKLDEFMSPYEFNDFSYDIYIDTDNIDDLNKNVDLKNKLLNDEYIKEIITMLKSILDDKEIYKIMSKPNFEDNELFITFQFKYDNDEAEKFLNKTYELFKLDLLKQL